ncbi:hypothetical protein [Streptomyces lunaelactis]|uniref:hypothetical protein n=1 Tax=Streptomyces lunaelactis TaxID=1535768 RepID=UPI0015853DC2|nr:hypothetical protein [Streptomyces lunaelactis]NUK14015.1 hypothetical protein [Streptomyces lunaelactis]
MDGEEETLHHELAQLIRVPIEDCGALDEGFGDILAGQLDQALARRRLQTAPVLVDAVALRYATPSELRAGSAANLRPIVSQSTPASLRSIASARR